MFTTPAIALLALAILMAPSSQATEPAEPTLIVQIDSSRREVTLRAGPFAIPASSPGAEHAHHGNHAAPGSQTPFLTFDWPVNGWLYAFTITLEDASGRPLPKSLIHHVNMMNLERRALLYDAVERTLAAGSETGDVQLPRSVGFPMRAGTDMGVLAAWASNPGADLTGVHLVITYRWSPTNLNPRPVDVLPLYLDVNYRGAGQTDSYDLPPGRSSKSFEFTLPVTGRLLGAGGHLHDYAIDLRLEEIPAGREVVRLKARLDADGKIQEVEQDLYGVRGDGIRLREGRRYRVTATYDNTTGALIPNGAMGIIIGLFAPDDMKRWPKVDLANPRIQADLEAITGGSMGQRGGQPR